VETNVEQCPLCGTELSVVKFREIQSKVREEERRWIADVEQATLAARQNLEQKFKLDLEKQKIAAEKKAAEEAGQEIKKVAAERDQAAKKLKEVEAREQETRKQAEKEIARQKQAAEKKANEEAEARVKKLAAERDQIAKKLKDSQEREEDLIKRAQQDADKQKQKELAELRQAFEKDKTLTLLKQQSEFNRERESLQKKMQLMDKQLQKKTANELGDGGEIDVFESLKGAFPKDEIERIRKGQPGADILHEVFYKGESCGKIILDSKNRQSWQNGFVTKLRQDQVEAGAEHAILATTIFPAGKRDLCVLSDVIVIAPAGVVHMVQVLRRAMIALRVMGLSMKERSSKMARLYDLVRSESYSRRFSEAGRIAQDILELDVQEKKAHDNVWKKRGTLATRINYVLREVETEVAAVIEGGDDEKVTPTFSVKSVRDVSTEPRTQEGV
jgi:hypothetical protein